MPTRLVLLRHGIALPHGTPGMADDDRPLTDKGEARMRMIARGLDRLGLSVETIATSPLPRARRTAEIAAEGLKLTDRIEDVDILRPGSPAGAIDEWVQSRGEDSLMLVGHNPNLNELLARLLGVSGAENPFGLKKGGIAELKRAGDSGYMLHWLATPRLIRKLCG